MIGFIGLGKMGSPMAINLLRARYRVAVYARNGVNAADVVKAGAELFDSRAHLASACEFVFTMVGTPADVQDLYLGDGGLVNNAMSNAVLVDMTTSSSDVARHVHSACKDRKIEFLDAPVTGGVSGAESGQLTFMVGGAEAVLEQVRSYFDTMGSQIVHVGDVGTGQIAKSCNQVAVAGIVLGATEALDLANKNGISADKMLQILNSGTASSPLLTSLQKRLRDAGGSVFFSVSQFIKDLRIASEEAHRSGEKISTVEYCLDYCENIEKFSSEKNGLEVLLEYYKKGYVPRNGSFLLGR